MKCGDCPYCYRDEEKPYANCHFEPQAPNQLPPCEEDDCPEDDDYPELY